MSQIKFSQYDKGKTVRKGVTEGGWAAIVASVVGFGINAIAPDLEPGAKAGAVAVVTGGIVAGVRSVRNWWKHRKD